MRYTPAGHRIIIKLDPVDTEVKDDHIEKDGIKFYLPKDSSLHKEKMQEEASLDEGEVVATGDQVYFSVHNGKHWCKVGDRVVFNRYAGRHLPKDKDSLLRIIEDVDVLAIVNK